MASIKDQPTLVEEVRETKGVAKQGKSRDIMSTLKGRVARIEMTVGETRDKLEEFEANMDELGSKNDELRGELHEIVEMLNHRYEALPDSIKSLQEEPKEFQGERKAKEVDNFLWCLEQYFKAMSITKDAL
ncbi:Uncharacterized protein TCM_033671 [Theobroma cacao]|uniref:Uncharacterized protein n=1 Tax=Theobroma cacao TaxID=3641 RepID=A0A061FBN0_THECC|nr:Uncharacterized protein TCM_033671 [Theobroma cacao]